MRLCWVLGVTAAALLAACGSDSDSDDSGGTNASGGSAGAATGGRGGSTGAGASAGDGPGSGGDGVGGGGDSSDTGGETGQGGGSGQLGGAGNEGGAGAGVIESCDEPITAGDPDTTASEDLPRLIAGPDAPMLITWSTATRDWHVRSYDDGFGEIEATLYDNRVSGESLPYPRAAVGYGYGLFLGGIVSSTEYIRRYEAAGDAWESEEAMVGTSLALGVRPTGDLLRVLVDGKALSLDNIDPVTGDVANEPIATLAFYPLGDAVALVTDADDRSVFAIADDATLKGFVIRDGALAASADLELDDRPAQISLVQLASGDVIALWAINSGVAQKVEMATLSYDSTEEMASWSEPTLVFDGQAANFVAAGTPDGELTAVFADGVTYALRYIDGAWSDPAEISEDIGGLPEIAVSSSGTVAVMLDPYPDEIIELHSVAKGSSAWSTVEAGGNFPYRPSIAFAPSGDLVAIWASMAPGDGGRREIALTRCR